MKIVADESVDFNIVLALRAAKFDVWAVVEQDPSIFAVLNERREDSCEQDKTNILF